MITGAVINTGALSGDNNCANCGYLKYGLGTNVRGDLGYFNGVEIQFNILGDLKGYKVSVTRTKTFIEARNGVPFNSGTNRADGPILDNVYLANGKIYSIDMSGFVYGSISAGTMSRDMIGHFTETAIIQDASGNVVSQYQVQWQSTINISRSSPDGVFIFSGTIGPR